MCEECLGAGRDDAAAAQGGKRDRLTDAQRAWYGSPNQMWDGPSVSRDIRQGPAPLTDGTIPGRDLKVGDVIVFLGRRYPVDRIEPYRGSLRSELGEGTRVAWSGSWGMTIGPDAAIRVLSRPGGGS